MQCSSSDRIKILRTIYGYNPGYSSITNPNADSCAFSVTDCHFDREHTIDNECTGRNSCLMTIRKSRVMNESLLVYQTCADFNYVHINYQCLPSSFTEWFCFKTLFPYLIDKKIFLLMIILKMSNKYI